MPAATGYDDSHVYWAAYLASSIGNYLTDQQPREQLVADYRLFRAAPVATPELRRLLPALKKEKR